MKRTFFQRYGLLVLMGVFFLVPFALRGARLAVKGMKNDVTDWLPASFDETADLNWFRDHFLGEQFVILSWDDCHGTTDDDRFRLMVDKFFPEVPPSQREKVAGTTASRSLEGAATGNTATATNATGNTATGNDAGSVGNGYVNEELGLYTRQLRPNDLDESRDFVGNRLGLFHTGDYHENWGSENEKWLRGKDDRWYYIKSNGEIYRWNGKETVPFAVGLLFEQLTTGGHALDGELVARLGAVDGPWYYADPRRLEADLFKSVTTGPGVLGDLVTEGGTLAGREELARDRLSGILFGPDSKQTCMIVTLTDAAKQDLHRVLSRGALGKPRGKLMAMAYESGVNPPVQPNVLPPPLSWFIKSSPPPPGPMLHVGGPAVDNVAIDEEGQITLVRLVGLSVVLGVGLTWLSFRSVMVTVMVLFVGGVSAVASVGFVWWFGSSVDAVLMSMPSLVYVLGISGAVHIVNYYRDAVESHGVIGASETALSHGWKPCTLAAITTALGLLSLTTSEIVPIEKFGLFAAIGVVATLVLLFTYLPAALQLWPPGYQQRDPKENDSKPGRQKKSDANGLPEAIHRLWSGVGHFVIRRHALVSVVSVVFLVVCGIGLSRLNTSIQLLKLFAPDANIIQDYRWLEGHMGKLVPLELVVKVRPEMMVSTEEDADGADSVPSEGATAPAVAEEQDKFRLSFLERMEISEYIRKAVEGQFGESHGDVVGQAMSAATFSPPLPRPGAGTKSIAIRGGMSRQMRKHRDDFLRSSDYLRLDEEDDSELWRISFRLGALNDVDYSAFVEDVKHVVEPIATAYQTRDQILRGIDKSRDGDGYRGARVFVLGAPFSKSKFAKEPLEVPLVDEGQESSGQNLSPWHVTPDEETALFAKTLYSLMKNAGLKLAGWHDPKYQLPVDYQEQLANGGYDCLIVMRDDPRYDLAALRSEFPVVIDASDHVFDQTAEQTSWEKKAPISVVYTGVVPVVYKAQRTLLNSLIRSTFWAFVMISIVMMLVLRSVRAGFVSMVPNLFPVVFVFGIMGWANILVDIGSMMTASVAMGVAVDDTIHFLTWFRRGLDEGRDRPSAIMLAYQRCATAMTQTTMIGGLGLSVFALSSFTPTQRFGVLMLTLMFAALIGDLIFLPAILAGPLGRVFGGKKPKKKSSSSPSLNDRSLNDQSALDSVVSETPHVPAPAGSRSTRPSSHLRADRRHRA